MIRQMIRKGCIANCRSVLKGCPPLQRFFILLVSIEGWQPSANLGCTHSQTQALSSFIFFSVHPWLLLLHRIHGTDK